MNKDYFKCFKIKTNKKETRNKWLEIISLPQEKDMYIYDPK